MKGNSLSHYAPLLVRLVAGISFIVHGFPKLSNIGGTAQFFAKIGIPLADVAAPFVGALEVFGGLALLLGLWTDAFAVLLALNMLVAIVVAKLGRGWLGLELELLLGVMTLSLLFSGPGKWALTRGWLSSRQPKDSAASA